MLGSSQNDTAARRRRLREGVATERLDRRYCLSQICDHGQSGMPAEPRISLHLPLSLSSPSSTFCCSSPFGHWARTLYTTARVHTKLSLQSGCCGCCRFHHPPPYQLLRCPISLIGSLSKLYGCEAKPKSHVLTLSTQETGKPASDLFTCSGGR